MNPLHRSDRRRVLVILDTEHCGIDAFDRAIGAWSADSTDLRIVVRSASGRPADLADAADLLSEATLVAQRAGFPGAGRAVVRNANDLSAELGQMIEADGGSGFHDASIVMPESSWPLSTAAVLRRTAQRWGALVRFDCGPATTD